jgi:hypothetical protein
LKGIVTLWQIEWKNEPQIAFEFQKDWILSEGICEAYETVEVIKKRFDCVSSAESVDELQNEFVPETVGDCTI